VVSREEQLVVPVRNAVGHLSEEGALGLAGFQFGECLVEPANSALVRMVQTHLTHWQRMLDNVSDKASVLVVTSGGSIEPAIVAALPHADHASSGPPFTNWRAPNVYVDW
jgi:hypothetical protein